LRSGWGFRRQLFTYLLSLGQQPDIGRAAALHRADDVESNARIVRAGAELMSVSEPVDDTPAGRLLYNIMVGVSVPTAHRRF
jgi:hypothetical protein